MKIEKLLSIVEDAVYGQYEEVSGVRIKKYLPFVEKVGLAKTLFQVLSEDGVYDSVNGHMFVPVFLFKKIAMDLDFPENDEDIDVDGVYDYLEVSGTLDNKVFSSELTEMKEIIAEFKEISYKTQEKEDSLSSIMKQMSNMNPEHIDALNSKVQDMMKDDNVRNMVNFSNK